MGISIENFRKIIEIYCTENKLNKKQLACKYSVKYNSLIDYFNGRRKSVSEYFENIFGDVIQLYNKEIVDENNLTNNDLVNMYNILPESSKGYVMYFLLKCLANEKSNKVLDFGMSLLSGDNKIAFEYHLMEITHDLIKEKEINITDSGDPDTVARIKKNINRLTVDYSKGV